MNEINNTSYSGCSNNTCGEEKINNSCSACTIENLPPGNLSNSRIIPILGNRLLQCVSIKKDDVGVNNEYLFTLNTDSPDYRIGQPVVIEKSSLTYDFIGLPQSLVNSTEVYIDGEIFNLVPDNLFNVGTSEAPEYLFSEMSGYISLKNHCCCNFDNSKSRQVKIVEYAKYFEVSNLVVNIEGYIGCTPFSASGIISDINNENDNFVRLTSLGILSSVTFSTYVCWPSIMQNILLKENFEFNLCTDCVRPVENYGVIESGVTQEGSILANVDFVFNVTKNINLLRRESIPILTNENINICSSGDILQCSDELISDKSCKKYQRRI